MVHGLATKVEASCMGLKQKLDISFADGMIGALPVFDSLKKAEEYSDGKFDISRIKEKITKSLDTSA